MQAIILAAGMGKRLKNLTQNNTKCMVKVNEVPLIQRMLYQLDKAQLSHIIIVVGYMADPLIDYIGSLKIKTPVKFVANTVYDKTNNIYSLFLVRKYLLQDDTLLLESDLIFDDCILQDLLKDPYPSLALVDKFESWMDGTVVTLKEDNTIDDFLDKAHFQFADIKKYYKTVNLYKFSREFSQSHYVPFLEAYCQALGNNEYYEQVLKVITKLDSSELQAKVLPRGVWYEIDDVQDLDIAESMFDSSGNGNLDRIQRRYGGYWRYPSMLDFCYLVNPYFPPQKLLDEIKANFDILACKYPSGQAVNSLLAAKFFAVNPSQIAVGNGAAELIKSVLTYLPGKVGLILPTFEEYPNRKPEDCIAFVPENPKFAYTADDIMQYFGNKAIDTLVLINPDNPSGNYIARDDVITLAKWTQKKNTRFIIDESFIDFADPDDTFIREDLLPQYKNTIVLKSISKAYGVPGLRLGVLASGDEALLNFIKKDVSIWNINSFGEFFLQICEKYKKDFKDALDQFYPVRDQLEKDLSALSELRVIPSKANYITCQVSGMAATALTQKLLSEHNIFIKDLSGKNGIDGEYIRVAVRTSDENTRLIEGMLLVLEHYHP